eukprot:Gregarina_sp_Poly_1__1826@NODE_1474_length_4049_cov_337_714716_g977_i0_p1_GENE_NODE_1474_length_4049_cov_337_714716_g977_i0NODE_1474_length_4049_cov_337_714716_g977_i0_p1_ORF_typecomplete_len486_score43_81HSP70/PF00012_20/7_3e14_NODE_1474_length_4049_cov_337_714716_g977_i025914003
MVADWCLLNTRSTERITPLEFIELQKRLKTSRHALSQMTESQFKFRGQILPFTRRDLEISCASLFPCFIGLIESMTAVKIGASCVSVGVDRILMVGGNSLIPWFKETLQRKWKNAELDVSLNCTEAVASGAALYAGGYPVPMEDVRNDTKSLRVHSTRDPEIHKIIDLYLEKTSIGASATFFVSVHEDLIDAFIVEIQSSKQYLIVEDIRIETSHSREHAELQNTLQFLPQEVKGTRGVLETERSGQVRLEHLKNCFAELQRFFKMEHETDIKVLVMHKIYSMLVYLPEKLDYVYFGPIKSNPIDGSGASAGSALDCRVLDSTRVKAKSLKEGTNSHCQTAEQVHSNQGQVNVEDQWSQKSSNQMLRANTNSSRSSAISLCSVVGTSVVDDSLAQMRRGGATEIQNLSSGARDSPLIKTLQSQYRQDPYRQDHSSAYTTGTHSATFHASRYPCWCKQDEKLANVNGLKTP